MTEVNSGQAERSGRSIGLFGGSFDPPHLGHVALVQAGLDLGLDEIWVIPALPVHRKLSGLADGEIRFSWLQKVFASEPRVKVINWEISQGSPTPAVETLRKFHKRYPDRVPWLMLGADAWNGLDSWVEYPAHRGLCNVAVFARKGMGRDIISSHAGWQLQQWSSSTGPGHYCYVTVELADVSATEIRRRAQHGHSLAGLVPSEIENEIEKHYT